MWETRIRMHSVGCPFDCLWSLQKILLLPVPLWNSTKEQVESLKNLGRIFGRETHSGRTLPSVQQAQPMLELNASQVCMTFAVTAFYTGTSGKNPAKFGGSFWGKSNPERAFCPLWQEKPTWNWNSVVQAHKHHYFDQIMAWHLCVTCSCDALCFAPGL